MSNEIAKTILAQLGGNRFIAMTGAHSFTSSNDSLSFQIPKANKKIKGVRITYHPVPDLYTMTFGYVCRKSFEWKEVAKYSMIYADQLQSSFTHETGLYTNF